MLRPLAALVLIFLSVSTIAQDAPRTSTDPGFVTRTFFLTNAAEARESNDLITALRNILDAHDKIYLLPTENAFVISAPPDQITLTEQLLKELDRPRHTYRLTYTLTTFDTHGVSDPKKAEHIGTEHFTMVVVSGERTVMKQGARLPVSTGGTSYTYLDVGMNFDASLDEATAGVRLRSKIESTSAAPEQSSGAINPVIRQTYLEGTSLLTPGKPVILGSIDLPSTTRRIDITVLMDLAS